MKLVSEIWKLLEPYGPLGLLVLFSCLAVVLLAQNLLETMKDYKDRLTKCEKALEERHTEILKEIKASTASVTELAILIRDRTNG